MKKMIFLGLVVFLTLFLACGPDFDPLGDGDIPSVRYSPDGSSITLRLDGGGANRQVSRSLTENLARAGYDYFEVIFVYGGKVARASWELGEAAGIKNVPREGTSAPGVGVNYGSANASVGGADAGSAILFVGTKQDKTLLAVGLLTSTDTVGTVVSASTSTATFTVAPLLAGADVNQASYHTKYLAYDNGTTATGILPTFMVGNRIPGVNGLSLESDTKILKFVDTGTTPPTEFPLYNIQAGQASITATYTIGSKKPFTATSGGGTAAPTVTGGINDYLPGIRVAAATANLPPITPKVPRYPRSGGLSLYAPAPHANSTTVKITNTYIIGDQFNPEIELEITTDGTSEQEGVISFCFDIPVYALSSAPMDGGPGPLTWHIRPGVGTSQYDLDNGKGSAGGSILLGVGNDLTLDWLWVNTIDHP